MRLSSHHEGFIFFFFCDFFLLRDLFSTVSFFSVMRIFLLYDFFFVACFCCISGSSSVVVKLVLAHDITCYYVAIQTNTNKM